MDRAKLTQLNNERGWVTHVSRVSKQRTARGRPLKKKNRKQRTKRGRPLFFLKQHSMEHFLAIFCILSPPTWGRTPPQNSTQMSVKMKKNAGKRPRASMSGGRGGPSPKQLTNERQNEQKMPEKGPPGRRRGVGGSPQTVSK